MAKTTKHKETGDPGHPPREETEHMPDERIVQRRLLQFVNAARLPEDLLKPPQRMRDTVGEHEREGGRMHNGEHPRTDPWEQAKLERDLALDIIHRRPIFGYLDIQQLLDIDRLRIPSWLEDLLRYLRARVFGSWSTPIPMEVGGMVIPIQNAAMLHTGEVLLIPSSTDTLLWDPNAMTFTLLNGATTGLTADLFCSGHSFLSDGKLLVAGGGGGGPGAASSIEAWKFDPVPKTWQKTVGNMNYQRWYPTVITLGDEPGRALVVSGWTGGFPQTAPQMEIYSETTDSFTTVSVSGPIGEKVGPQTYPGLHLLPGGEIFYVSVGFGDCMQSPSTSRTTEDSGFFTFSGPISGSWTDTGPNIRTKGMSVLLLQPTYPFVQVLVVGGGDAAQSATGQLINLSTLSPTWGSQFPLLHGRVHPNVVLLPDGTAFICGGMGPTGPTSTGGPCELYDPVAGTLSEMAEVNYPRHYHSVALLLPSGQVMAAGGAVPTGCSLSDNNTIEVFSPPYLYRGTRPTIAALPSLVHHGHTFDIESPDASNIARVSLVWPMAVTHQTDTGQRVISLSFVKSGASRLTATMPDGMHPHGMAPRGYYMLFILNGNGVPSEGKFIFLH
jgi:hypothetical protein